MSLLGIGTDLVEVERIAGLLGEHPERFLERCFRPADAPLRHAEESDFPARLAASWAAKEAFLKALGGDPRAIPYRDIELVDKPGNAPTLNLYGVAEEMGRTLGIGSIRVSVSRTSAAAVALVVLES